ncbi:putative F-box protein [Platanthera guangdongensis]|uniref:F-box protein n=1 Tax=Platanthera guangdongensis TaxID=2320717 RepID=A0ABR2MBE9_9ASPA
MKMRKRAVTMKTAETKKKKSLMMRKKNKMPLEKSERMAGEKIGLYIPVDIVSEILLNLPARSLGKFRCVSKSWLSITSNTAFIRANAQRNRITRHSLIIGSKMRPKSICLASAEATISKFSIRLREYHLLKRIPEYSYALASCDGLVCLYNNIQSYVINPLTRQSIALPKDGVFLTCKLGFYFHPSTCKYRLIRFTDTMHESEVLVVGESSWRRIPGNLPAFFHCPYPLDLKGNMHWLAHSRNENRSEFPPDTLVIFDEEKEVYSVISLPPLEKLHHLGGHLMDFNGVLGLWVVDKNNTIDVWIMKDVWINSRTENRPERSVLAFSRTIPVLNRLVRFGSGSVLGFSVLFAHPHSLHISQWLIFFLSQQNPIYFLPPTGVSRSLLPPSACDGDAIEISSASMPASVLIWASSCRLQEKVRIYVSKA